MIDRGSIELSALLGPGPDAPAGAGGCDDDMDSPYGKSSAIVSPARHEVFVSSGRHDVLMGGLWCHAGQQKSGMPQWL